MRLKQFKVIPFILFFAGSVFAQQSQTLPIGAAMQLQPSMQSSILQQPFPQQAQPATYQQQPHEGSERREGVRPPLAPQREERLSPFEQYLSDKTITITDNQFEILRKFAITFSYNSRTPSGSIAVPVRIVKNQGNAQSPTTPINKYQEKTEDSATPIDMEAGFLIGPSEVITEVFNILGIKNSLTASTDPSQFGYALFTLPPSTFAPGDKVPVGPDYVLGPGDEIKTTVWGKIEGQWNVVVDREGNVTLPKVGVLGVAGLTFKELKEILSKELSKYYTGFEMNVSM